jgi:hypothetical protein
MQADQDDEQVQTEIDLDLSKVRDELHEHMSSLRPEPKVTLTELSLPQDDDFRENPERGMPHSNNGSRRVSFVEDEEPFFQVTTLDHCETTSETESATEFHLSRRRAMSCMETSNRRPSTSAAASSGCNAAEELAECLEELSQAERSFGSDDPRIARCLRRMAMTLMCQGRSSQAIPLWIRVLEIERPLLGMKHPDILALEDQVIKELSQPGISPETAAAYSLQLRGCSEDSPSFASRQAHHPPTSRNLAAAAASIGGASAAVVGGAVVSGALSLGLTAVSSTCSLLSNATGHLVGYAAAKTTATVLGATPVPAPLVTAAASAAGLAGSGAVEAAHVAAGGALGVVSQVGVSLASSVTSSAISHATNQAWNLFYGQLDESCNQGVEVSHTRTRKHTW